MPRRPSEQAAIVDCVRHKGLRIAILEADALIPSRLATGTRESRK